MKNLLPPLLVCLLFLAATLPRPAAGQSYEVRGRMESTFQRPNDPASQTNSRNFIVATDGRDVFIRFNPGAHDKGIDYHEFGTHGTNSYQLVKFQTRTNSSGKHKPGNDATMGIYTSLEPQTSVPTIRRVWRAYVTQRALREAKDNFIRPNEPVWLNGNPIDTKLTQILGENMQLRAEWAFDGQPPFLLQRLIDYQDATFDSKQYSNALIPDEFVTGQTNSRMDVVAWTNIAGLHLPTDIQVLTYLAGTNLSGPQHVLSTHRIVATNVLARTSRTSFIPALTSATRILDHRFAKGPSQPPDYTSTNGVILPTFEDAWKEVRRRYEESRRRMEERERAKALELLPEEVSPAK